MTEKNVNYDKLKIIAEKVLTGLKNSNLTSGSALVVETKKDEISYQEEMLNLYRTTLSQTLNTAGLVDHKKGTSFSNKTDDASIAKICKEVFINASSSAANEANEMSPFQKSEIAIVGDTLPDKKAMLSRLKELLATVKTKYPQLKIIICVLDFTLKKRFFANTNGVQFFEQKGVYNFDINFATKDGKSSTSMNYISASSLDLEKPLLEWGDCERLIAQNVAELNAIKLGQTFEGEILLPPETLRLFSYFLFESFITDEAILSGSSPWIDKLNKKVMPEFITIKAIAEKSKNLPVAEKLFTMEGFRTANEAFIEKGVLKNYAISNFVAKQTKFPRSLSFLNSLVVESGTERYKKLISRMKRGIILGRFSGGNPAPNGDFSGVAKNSLLVVDGKIVSPITQTMVSGNLQRLFENTIALSDESVNYGYECMPWLLSKDVTI